MVICIAPEPDIAPLGDEDHTSVNPAELEEQAQPQCMRDMCSVSDVK